MSNTLKAHSARAPRHGLTRRNTSYTKLHIPSKTQARPCLPSRALSSPKVTSLGKKRTPTEIEDNDEDDDMATSFLQYCATCEKQIVVPNNTILYCSEKCRAKDTGDSPDASLPLSPKRSPTSSPLLDAALSLIPPREPSTLASLGLKPPILHSAKADLDPTEWKPDNGGAKRAKSAAALPTLSGCSSIHDASSTESPTCGLASATRPVHARSRSTAALAFLASFHRVPDNLSFSPRSGTSSSSTPRGIARTAPGYFSFAGGMQDSAGTSPSLTESVPGTPREGFEGEGKVQIRGAGIGSGSSLKSLAVPVEARDGEGLGIVGGVWIGEGKETQRAAEKGGMNTVEGRLRKLLHEM